MLRLSHYQDMQLYFVIKDMFNGIKPTDKDIEFVADCMKIISDAGSEIWFDETARTIYTEIAGKCYIFCMWYERLWGKAE